MENNQYGYKVSYAYFFILPAGNHSPVNILIRGIYSHLQVSALLGRIPSAVGYQPTLATDMGSMQERITTTKKGSITSVQVILLIYNFDIGMQLVFDLSDWVKIL